MTTSTTNSQLIDELKGSGARMLRGSTVGASPTSAPLSVVHAPCSLHGCHLDAGLERMVTAHPVEEPLLGCLLSLGR